MRKGSTLDVSQGAIFSFQGTQHCVVARLDMEHVIARPLDGKIAQSVSISEILADDPEKNENHKRNFAALETIDPEAWAETVKRQNAILSIDGGDSPLKVANSLGVTVRHLFVLRKQYEVFGIEGLIKQKPPGGVGKSRTAEALEEIIIGAIKDVYLTPQKRIVAKVIEAVEVRCNSALIPPPGRSTIYRRCHAIDQKEKDKKRLGSKSLKNIYSQTFDGYQEATRPLEIIQIDHTKMDIFIVDEETRECIGRPFLTIAIDVYSRMVFGYLISLDEPSTMSTALCLQQAICKKDKWLAERGIKHSWGIYGLPESLHFDNGKEFHSKTLRCGCQKHEIHIIFRPVGKTEYGGHIERLIGTFMGEMKVLPGATFSNIQEKGEYDSEKHSAMTLRELDKWFGTLVTGRYHKKVHSALHMNPEQRFLEGLQGNQKEPGAGINRIIIDEDDLLMDFTPLYEKTVQNYGVRIQHINYNSAALKPFVNAIDKKTGKKKKFVVRRDPRDLSVAYFFDPVQNRYITIPYRNKSRPKISHFEYRWALNKLKERGKIGQITEEEIFRTLDELNEIEQKAIKKTKKARRNSEKKKVHRATSGQKENSKKPVFIDVEDDSDNEVIIPFEIETNVDQEEI